MVSLFGSSSKEKKPGFLDRLKQAVASTKAQLVEKIEEIVEGRATLDESVLDKLEATLITADLGVSTTQEILGRLKQQISQGKLRETAQLRPAVEQGILAILEKPAVGSAAPKAKQPPPGMPAVIFVVGVNGVGKTTSIAKLAHYFLQQNRRPLLCAGDTFRAAAIEQIKFWGQRLKVEVIAGAYGADAASVAHDAVTAAQARKADYLFIDTAGRQHTKHNLMQELQKLHRVIGKQLPGAPHEVLLVLDATTGMNALNQAREFNKAVPLTGLVVTKLDGTSKGGMVVAIQKELGLPIKFIGLGEQPDDLQPFDAKQFAQALFEE